MISPRNVFPAVALAALSTLASLGVAVPGTARADEPRVQWEHRCIEAPRAEDLEPVLNRWGDDGWQLATAISTNGASRLCLKRARGMSPAARACFPACGDGNYCLDGKCVPCVPTCRVDEMCAPSGICMPRQGGPSGPGGAAVDAVQWQPTREELNGARAVLQPSADRCAAASREDGQAVISMTILGGGTVTAAKAKQTTLSDKTLRCIEDAARALRFRPFRAALIAVDMPVSVHGKPPAPSKLGD